MIKGKKAGFEMSITTIVVLVIAVIMLILGIFLVRTIMCGGIGLAKQTLEGAAKEIDDLFTERGGEIVCVGERSPVTAIPDNYNFVGCGFSPKRKTTYNYTYELEVEKNKGVTKEEVLNTWILGGEESLSDDSFTIDAGDRQSALIKIYPPSNAPEILLTFKLYIDGSYKSQINVKVTSVGWMRETIC